MDSEKAGFQKTSPLILVSSTFKVQAHFRKVYTWKVTGSSFACKTTYRLMNGMHIFSFTGRSNTFKIKLSLDCSCELLFYKLKFLCKWYFKGTFNSLRSCVRKLREMTIFCCSCISDTGRYFVADDIPWNIDDL